LTNVNNLFVDRKNCPICESHNIDSVYKHRFDEFLIKKYLSIEYPLMGDFKFPSHIYFEISKCLACNLFFQKYIFNEESVDIVYNEWIDHKTALCDHINNGRWKTSYNRRILDYASYYLKKPPERISFLDYGAGFGAALDVACELGFKTHAVEYSQSRIDYLNSKGIKTFAGNPAGEYDFIICDQVLEHVNNPVDLIRTIYNLLSPGGLLYLAVPNCSGLEMRLLNSEKILDPSLYHSYLYESSIGAFQHINFFNNKSLQFLLNKEGFEPFLAIKSAFMMPMSAKNFLRPFYHRYLSTVFFATKVKARKNL
jgi:2-polyprenyl-3-methyl-5-hydroxy-6-metoxy-1,4-benzoquinol methylase